jgi:sec-independent protein translocase protein TatA
MGLGWKELLIILVIVLVVFGTKKLTNLGKDLGGAIGGFKKGLKEGEETARLGVDADGDKPADAAKAPADQRDGDGQG